MFQETLTNKIVRLLKRRHTAVDDVPVVLLEAVVDNALNVLLEVFDDDEGNPPEFELAPMVPGNVTLSELLNNVDEWVECEDGSVWPESMTSESMDGVRMPTSFVEGCGGQA